MWNYEKRLQHPVNIKNPNAKMAKFIITQFGGPNGNRVHKFMETNTSLGS
jgi:Mn-containing catalase